MFDIGFAEMLIIGAIALIAIGPKQLPEIARTVGKFLADIRSSTSELTRTFQQAKDETLKPLIDIKDSVETSTAETRQTAEQAFADAVAAAKLPDLGRPVKTSVELKSVGEADDKKV